jgi:AcrR family transcriptional regulator
MKPPRIDGRQLRWQRHNEQRRQQVIDAAILVLEDVWPKAEIHVQQIADKAGINRSVLYRYFEDRTDLDVAVQQEICLRVSESLVPAITLDGTPREIVHRIVSAYVTWAAEHAALVRFAEQDIPGADHRPMEVTIELIAAQVEQIIEAVAAALGAELSPADRAALEPWVFGLIGGGMTAVRRWTGRPELEPAPDVFARLVAGTVWFQIDGLATERGITIPDVPIDEFIDALTTAD